MAAVIY